MTALTTTKAVLRKRIARLFDDVTTVTATANGTTTTLIDTIRLGNSIERPNGREIVFTSGTNAGSVRRITSSDMTTGTLTFAAVGLATATNDTAELYNFRGKGFSVDAYNDAINMAIDQAWPLYGTRVMVSAAAVFDTDTTTIDIPSGIDQIEAVEYQDVNDLWQEVPQATQRFRVGWSVEADGTDVVVRGYNLRSRMDDRSIRLIGYTRATTLTADTDTTAIPPEWIIYTAAEQLCLSKRDDAALYNLGLVYRDKAEKAAASIRTRRRGRAYMVTP
jgi:hypothetical protein